MCGCAAESAQDKGKASLGISASARQLRGRKLGNGLPVQGGGQAVFFGDRQDGFDQIVCGRGGRQLLEVT